MKNIDKLKEELEKLNAPEHIEKQHQKGKLTARERIDLLVDNETFVETDPFVESRFLSFKMGDKKVAGDGAITGFAKIKGRPVYIYSQDFSKIGGSLGEKQAEKIVKLIESAQKTGAPVIAIIDSGGARIQEGISSLDGYAKIFQAMTKASGLIPQISIIAGPSAGGASYSPGLSDFVFMIEGMAQMYITGPEVIETVIGEKVSLEGLGGTEVHSQKSGCAHFAYSNEQDCFLGVKKLLSYLPQNNMENPLFEGGFFSDSLERENFDLERIIPDEDKKGYEVRSVIKEIFDKDSFFEIQERFAPNVVIGLARLGGEVTGVVANQPKVLAGCLDIDSSDKIARFVRFCDSFNIPLINLVDTPGYLPGKDQEHRGIIRHGAKILHAYSEATVPKISLILRKAFGGAYIALSSRFLGYDKVYAWPSAQIAVMGAEQAVKIIYKKEIAENDQGFRKEKIKEYEELFLNPWEAAKFGQVDAILSPKDTRNIIIKTMFSLKNKRESRVPKKHGNIPF